MCYKPSSQTSYFLYHSNFIAIALFSPNKLPALRAGVWHDYKRVEKGCKRHHGDTDPEEAEYENQRAKKHIEKYATLMFEFEACVS